MHYEINKIKMLIKIIAKDICKKNYKL